MEKLALLHSTFIFLNMSLALLSGFLTYKRKNSVKGSHQRYMYATYFLPVAIADVIAACLVASVSYAQGNYTSTLIWTLLAGYSIFTSRDFFKDDDDNFWKHIKNKVKNAFSIKEQTSLA